MRSAEVIKEIAKREGISMGELAKRVGISRQALYKRLEGDMKSSNFIEMVEAMGYRVLYGRDD